MEKQKDMILVPLKFLLGIEEKVKHLKKTLMKKQVILTKVKSKLKIERYDQIFPDYDEARTDYQGARKGY